MPQRILLVDDSSVVRLTYEVALRRAGFEVDTAPGGAEALELLGPDHPYALVVSDLEMPGMSGHDLVTTIRESPCNNRLPVLMLTGSSERSDIISNLAAGVSDYVHKEPDKAVFLARLRRLLEWEEMHEKLKQASRTDVLTGLTNRSHGSDRLEEEISRARRYERPLAVALLDIDHFKRVNDTWGHHAGDDVLVAVSHKFSTASRSSDCVIRWGGEEFLFLLPETELHDAVGILERLRCEIGDAPIGVTAPEGSVSAEVTLSGGVAALEPGDTLETLVDRADAGLYRAKETGRNRLLQAVGGELLPVTD